MSGDSKIEKALSRPRWSQVANAGGFALRYADPLLQWLWQATDSEADAREILMYLVNRLAQKGFGEKAVGRLPDYLLKTAIRVAEAYYKQIRPSESAEPQKFQATDADWLRLWSENLVARAWRSLERYEHGHPTTPVYSVLRASLEHPDDPTEALSRRLTEEYGIALDEASVSQTLNLARRRLAKYFYEEVADTLTTNAPAEVVSELQRLGLEDWVLPYLKPASPPSG